MLLLLPLPDFVPLLILSHLDTRLSSTSNVLCIHMNLTHRSHLVMLFTIPHRLCVLGQKNKNTKDFLRMIYLVLNFYLYCQSLAAMPIHPPLTFSSRRFLGTADHHPLRNYRFRPCEPPTHTGEKSNTFYSPRLLITMCFFVGRVCIPAGANKLKRMPRYLTVMLFSFLPVDQLQSCICISDVFMG